jgi:dienelactone hydrolase
VREFIVVAPQLPVAGDTWHRAADSVRQIISAVHANHGGDHSRTYLKGFSFGGNGVFDLAVHQRGLWAAIWSVDPTRVPSRDPAAPVWLSFGEISRYSKSAFIRALALQPFTATPLGERVYADDGQDIYAWLLSKRL